MVPIANAAPPDETLYQSIVSPDKTLAVKVGIGLPAQYSLSPPLTGDETTGQLQLGAVTDKVFVQLEASVRVSTILVPVGTLLTVQIFPL